MSIVQNGRWSEGSFSETSLESGKVVYWKASIESVGTSGAKLVKFNVCYDTTKKTGISLGAFREMLDTVEINGSKVAGEVSRITCGIGFKRSEAIDAEKLTVVFGEVWMEETKTQSVKIVTDMSKFANLAGLYDSIENANPIKKKTLKVDVSNLLILAKSYQQAEKDSTVLNQLNDVIEILNDLICMFEPAKQPEKEVVKNDSKKDTTKKSGSKTNPVTEDDGSGDQAF